MKATLPSFIAALSLLFGSGPAAAAPPALPSLCAPVSFEATGFVAQDHITALRDYLAD